jgi:beta-phosphoglucomutase-like phosphatase (HAD superfamily)
VIDTPFAQTLSMSLEEYASRVIGKLCRCACLSADHAGLLVNYTQLPEAVWQEIAAHFGIRFSSAEVETMRNIAAFHAKHPRAKFAPDGEFKRLGISSVARQAAARWIQPHYQELEKLRLRGRPVP